MIRKFFKAIVAVLALIFMIGVTNGYRTKKKLVRYCSETTTGASLTSARERALRNGFRFFDTSAAGQNSNKALVTASGVLGRYVCEIEYDGNRVVKASLLFND